MNVAQDRIMAPMEALFRAAADIPEETIHAVEGAVEQGELSVKVLMVADNFVTLWIRRGKGLVDPVHQHDDHESVATLVSGRLWMKIGDEEFVAGRGTSGATRRACRTTRRRSRTACRSRSSRPPARPGRESGQVRG